MKVVVHDRAEAVAGLKTAWDDLMRAVPQASASLSFDFAMCGWETLAKGPHTRLAVVTVWEGDRLLCVWPLYVDRAGLASVACHLGCGDLHEYAGPLVREDQDTAAVVRAALEAVKGLADVVKIYNVRAPGPVAETLAADRTPKRQSFILCPVVDLSAMPDWETFSAAMSKGLRTQLRYDRRQLERLGDVRFREMAGPEDGPRCLDFILGHKVAWADARQIRHSFILEPQFRRFFEALAVRPAPADPTAWGVRLYALTVGDQIVAACINLKSGDRLEFHTTTYDPAYARQGPGKLMIEDCVKLSIALGVDFDFRLARQDYKGRWASRDERHESFHLACTPMGVVQLRIETVDAGIRRFRAAYGPKIKALLKRGR